MEPRRLEGYGSEIRFGMLDMALAGPPGAVNRGMVFLFARVSAKLTEADPDEIMNPAHYTGLSEYFVEAVVGKED